MKKNLVVSPDGRLLCGTVCHPEIGALACDRRCLPALPNLTGMQVPPGSGFGDEARHDTWKWMGNDGNDGNEIVLLEKNDIPINDHWRFNDVVSWKKAQAEWLSARHGHFETAKLRGSLGLTWLNPRHVLNRLHAINLGKSAHDFLNLLVFQLWCTPSIVYSSIQYESVREPHLGNLHPPHDIVEKCTQSLAPVGTCKV